MNERRNLLTGLYTKDELLDLGFIEGNDVKTECGTYDVIGYVAIPLNYYLSKTSTYFDFVDISLNNVSAVTSNYNLALDSYLHNYYWEILLSSTNLYSKYYTPIFYWDDLLPDYTDSTTYTSSDLYEGTPNREFYSVGDRNGGVISGGIYAISGSHARISTRYLKSDVTNNKEDFYIVTTYGISIYNGRLNGRHLKPRNNEDYSNLLFTVIKDKTVTFKGVTSNQRKIETIQEVSIPYYDNYDDRFWISLDGCSGHYVDIVNTYSQNFISAPNKLLIRTDEYEKSSFSGYNKSLQTIWVSLIAGLSVGESYDVNDDAVPNVTIECTYRKWDDSYYEFDIYLRENKIASFEMYYDPNTQTFTLPIEMTS